MGIMGITIYSLFGKTYLIPMGIMGITIYSLFGKTYLIHML